MELISHKIGESFTLLVDNANVKSYRIFRANDGKYFNKERKLFVFETADNLKGESYNFGLYPHTVEGIKVSRVNYLPKIQQDLVFEFIGDSGVLYRERHVFGGLYDESKPDLCIVYGTVYDPSGRPIPSTRVEASLNKKGYFIDKVPVLGTVASVTTDDRGYFELPLLQGINVTLSIPALGFNTTGYVPKSSSVPLSGYCLLGEGYGN